MSNTHSSPPHNFSICLHLAISPQICLYLSSCNKLSIHGCLKGRSVQLQPQVMHLHITTMQPRWSYEHTAGKSAIQRTAHAQCTYFDKCINSFFMPNLKHSTTSRTWIKKEKSSSSAFWRLIRFSANLALPHLMFKSCAIGFHRIVVVHSEPTYHSIALYIFIKSSLFVRCAHQASPREAFWWIGIKVWWPCPLLYQGQCCSKLLFFLSKVQQGQGHTHCADAHHLSMDSWPMVYPGKQT